MVTQESIKRALEQLFLNEGEAFIGLWDSLSPKQKNLLIAISSNGTILLHSQSAIMKYELGSGATVNKSLKILENKGILEREGGKFVFSDIFFKEWIKIRACYPGEDYTIIETSPKESSQFPLPPSLNSL